MYTYICRVNVAYRSAATSSGVLTAKFPCARSSSLSIYIYIYVYIYIPFSGD